MAGLLAQALPCPLVSRDAINEGIFHTFDHDLAVADKESVDNGHLRREQQIDRLEEGIESHPRAEAAFQDQKWRLGLDSVTADADIKVVHCVIHLRLARRRVTEREREQPDSPSSRRAALARSKETGGRAVNGFEELSLAVPSLGVATAKGYDPSIEAIIDFIRA
jgi:hypothetical protein